MYAKSADGDRSTIKTWSAPIPRLRWHIALTRSGHRSGQDDDEDGGEDEDVGEGGGWVMLSRMMKSFPKPCILVKGIVRVLDGVDEAMDDADEAMDDEAMMRDEC